MALFVGIFLAGKEWGASYLNVTAQTSTPLPDKRRASLKDGNSNVEFLKKIDHASQLRFTGADMGNVQAIRNEVDISKAVAVAIRSTGLTNHFKEHVELAMDDVRTVGFAHSFGLSPTIRRGLPAMLKMDVIEQHRNNRNERSTAIYPSSQTAGGRGCAIEAPFAACLELLAQQMLKPCEHVIILGESGDGIEATKVRVIRDASKLIIAAEKYTSGTLSEVEKWMAKLLHRSSVRDSSPENLVIVFVEGTEDFHLLIGSEQRQLSLSLTDIALGAARYAALCAGENPSVAINYQGIQKVQFESIVPHSIGICGQSPTGAVIWCPLFEAGDRLSGNSRSIHFLGDDVIPPRLILASSTKSDRIPGEWIEGSDQLRWYAEVPVDVPKNVSEGCVMITIEDSTDCWDYGWSDPFVRASFVQRAPSL